MDSWYWQGLRAIAELADDGEPFTSDDVHQVVADPPHHNQMGRLFGHAKQMGLIQQTGRWVQSKRPESKGRRIAEWKAADLRQGALL